MRHVMEPAPEYGMAQQIAPGIRRIVAPNPGPMTYHGTNTWLIEVEGGTVVLDPGPDDAGHVQAVLREAGHIAGIFVSHKHHDHIDAVPALRAASGAPVYGFGVFRPDVIPDVLLKDGDSAFGLQAVHTPGHCSMHLCFAREDGGVLFTADHVMGWSTSVISPPGGNMREYLASLDKLLARNDRIYLPAHGPAIEAPAAYVHALKEHRQRREAAILSALRSGAADIPQLVRRLYPVLDARLQRMAGQSVLSHLVMLAGQGHVVQKGEKWVLVA